MAVKMKKKITEEGLIIPLNVLKSAGLEGDVDIVTRGHTIIVKPESFTEKVRGIIKGTPLSEKDLEELYHVYKGD
ncbi:hypothetical protein BMS3Bbin15_00010 [archaeon BMS3Bbin15]|nr:hypothetical protein BMS3Bbin15_00010 [archaeon BMS3Bbin15]